jgi:uncharacterized protein (TIGR02246 family)
MLVRRLAPSALLFLTACGASPAPTPCAVRADTSGATRQQIEDVSNRSREAVKRGDMKAVMSFYGPDSMFLNVDGAEPAADPAAIEAAYKSEVGKVKEMDASPREIEIVGDVAYEIGVERATMLDGSGFHGKYLTIWKRQPDGRWLIHRDVFQNTYDGAKDAAGSTAVVAPTAPSPPVACPDPAAVRRQIEQTEARGLEALKREDAAGFAAAFAPDGAYFSPGAAEPLRGPSAIASYLQPALAKLGRDRTLTVKDVEVHGDTAFETGTEVITRAHNRYHAKFVAIWKEQHDGTWLVSRRIHTVMDEPLPTSAPWSDTLSDEEKEAIMQLRVAPAMAKVFKAEDAKKYASFDCGTCHGNGKDPKDVLPKLTKVQGKLTCFADKPAASRFMAEKVVPAMAQALGVATYDAASQKGWGCAGCHAVEEK